MMFNKVQKYQVTASYSHENGDLVLYLPGTTTRDQQLFLKNLKADIFLTLKRNNTIIPLHSFRVIDYSGFIRRHANERNIIIEQNLKESILTKVLSVFYGYSFSLDRNSISQYYHIIYFLQIDILLKLIQDDIFHNLHEYDIFIVIQLSYRYNLREITDKCMRELLNEQFQQMKYNIYDLLRCSQQVFRAVILHHNKMRSEKKVKGFTWEQIQQIVKQYSQANKLTTTKTARLLHELVDHKELFLQQRKKIHGNEDAPKQRIIQSRNQLQHKMVAPRKLSESFIAQQYVVKTPLTPVRTSTFYSHIFGSDSAKTENNSNSQNDNGAFVKKQIKGTEYMNITVNNTQSSMKFNYEKQKIKINISPLEGVRTVSIDQQEKSQEKPVNYGHNRFVTQPNLLNINYLTDDTKLSPSPKSAEHKTKTFKVWQSQHKKSASKLNTSSNKPKRIDEKQIQNLITSNKSIKSNQQEHHKDNFQSNVSKDVKLTYPIKYMDGFQDIRKLSKEKLHGPKFQSTPNFTFQDENQFHQNLNNKEAQIKVKQTSTLLTRARTKTVNQEVRTRRNTSYFPSKEPIRSFSHKKPMRQKTQLVKQIQKLNIQSQKCNHESQQMLNEIKKIKDEYSKRDKNNEQYKSNLKKIDTKLKKLQKDIGNYSTFFSKLQQKIKTIIQTVQVKV